MTATGSTDGMHRGDTIPFWKHACEDGRRNACERLLQIESSYCGDNSGWACNELGVHYTEGKIVRLQIPSSHWAISRRHANSGSRPAASTCWIQEDPARQSRASLTSGCSVREGGPNLMEMSEPELYTRACKLTSWTFACDKSVALTLTGRHQEPSSTTEPPPPEVSSQVQDPQDQPERSTSIGGLVLLAALILGVSAWMSFQRPQPVASVEAGARTAAAVQSRQTPPGFGQMPGFSRTTSFLASWRFQPGRFLMGSDTARDALAFDNEQWSDAHAQGMVDLPVFYIGRYEVTVAQFRAFVEATGFRVDDQALRGPPSIILWRRSPGQMRSPTVDGSRRRSGSGRRPRRDCAGCSKTAGGLVCRARRSGRRRRGGRTGRIYPWGNAARRDRANYEGERSRRRWAASAVRTAPSLSLI